ncbi:type II secretion system GspH family protein [Methylobacillus caricis]|uniref:type II secretion system protein n=1 Tax=Methylobacillus caricis TaxID=1971611 RepID=UPI001D000F0D|nr:prepilin-type N-terminal cleavage/methylation domain-containing protein [Methylobacillus caricis]MCB5188730.1 type II secretion system GspH family protein [Methylobacillus caricis]
MRKSLFRIPASGFTLVELLVVLAILMLLLTVAAPRYFNGVDRAKEAALKQTLYVVRDAIDKFHSDNARYPDSLEELAERKYIRTIPVDPLTESAESWIVVPPDEELPGNLYDLHSGAEGTAADGSQYGEW